MNQFSNKCANCGKPRDQHNALTKACPIGRKHRTIGYTQYSARQAFRPKFGAIAKPLPNAMTKPDASILAALNVRLMEFLGWRKNEYGAYIIGDDLHTLRGPSQLVDFTGSFDALVAAAMARQWVAEQTAKFSTARERHARRLFPWLLLCLAVALLVLAHAVWIAR